MTTAHRPTWAPARGGEEQGGNRMFVPSLMRSSKDATAQTKLKMRQDGQGASGADFKVGLSAFSGFWRVLFAPLTLAKSNSQPAPLSLSLSQYHTTTGGAAARGAQGGRQEAGPRV